MKIPVLLIALNQLEGQLYKILLNARERHIAFSKEMDEKQKWSMTNEWPHWTYAMEASERWRCENVVPLELALMVINNLIDDQEYPNYWDSGGGI